MNKLCNFLRLLRKKFTKFNNFRKENLKNIASRTNNVIKEVRNEYIGKVGVLIIFIFVLIKYWRPSQNPYGFELLQLNLPVIVAIIILLINMVLYIVMQILISLDKNNWWFTKLIVLIDDKVMHSVSYELNSNAFGLIFGNIILLATFYNQRWGKLAYKFSIKSSIVLLIFFVILPLFFCWLNTVLYGAINVLKKIIRIF
ncbi:MAG TPA: hypothetical protein PKD00_04570 [Burkholderiales bacterium]|nr:hypothetical protein [Burkholderiales bacterium]